VLANGKAVRADVERKGRWYDASFSPGLDPAGKVVDSSEKSLAPWTAAQPIASFAVPTPALWSPKTPNLYTCAVTLQSPHGEHEEEQKQHAQKSPARLRVCPTPHGIHCRFYVCFLVGPSLKAL